MGFKAVKHLARAQQRTVEFAGLTQAFGIKRAVIDMNYLAYFVEEVKMYCDNAGTILDTIEEEMVRARISAKKFDENSVPLTKKEKNVEKQIHNIAQQITLKKEQLTHLQTSTDASGLPVVEEPVFVEALTDSKEEEEEEEEEYEIELSDKNVECLCNAVLHR